MRDARRRPRDVVDQFLPVRQRETGELVGYLTDVSVDGGMIEARAPLEEGNLYHLHVELEDSTLEHNKVDFDARCVWVRKERNAVFYRVGIELVATDTETRERLQAIAEEYRLSH